MRAVDKSTFVSSRRRISGPTGIVSGRVIETGVKYSGISAIAYIFALETTNAAIRQIRDDDSDREISSIAEIQ